MKSKRYLILFILLASCLFAGNAWAGTATVSWNANTESDLASYKVYYGTSARTSTCTSNCYSNSINVGRVTSYTFSNLTNGSTYYFAVTALDTAGLESGLSTEVHKLITSTTKTGDIFGNDGIVNVQDLGVLLGNWGNPTNLAADIFGNDGIVNVQDLGVLLGNWG